MTKATCRPLKFTGPKLFKSVVYSDTVLKILTGPPEMEEDHQILRAGGPLGQCSRNVISNHGDASFAPQANLVYI